MMLAQMLSDVRRILCGTGLIRMQVRVRVCGNKYKEEKKKRRKDEGEKYCRGKKWWLLGDTREPPKKPPGIFHSELKRIGEHQGGKRTQKSRTIEESRHANNLQASLHAYNMYPYGVL